VQNFEFASSILTTKDSEWQCTITRIPGSIPNGGVEFNVSFRLVKGKMTSTGVAVAFDFADWSTDNYVMVPASIYNGNRNKIEQRGYCTGFEKEDFYNKDNY